MFTRDPATIAARTLAHLVDLAETPAERRALGVLIVIGQLIEAGEADRAVPMLQQIIDKGTE